MKIFFASEDPTPSISQHVMEECKNAVHEMERKAADELFGSEKTAFPLLLSLRASCAVPLVEGRMVIIVAFILLLKKTVVLMIIP